MSDTSAAPAIPRKFLFSFVLVTVLFALWSFANDITNPLVAAFNDIFVINNAQSSWVQMAFYGGYGTMAIPAALFIRRYSYRAGIIVGLSLYAIGAFICIPAANIASFNTFLVALYVLTFGLAFLETIANPYILSSLEVEDFRTDFTAHQIDQGIVQAAELEHKVLPFPQSKERTPANDPDLAEYIRAQPRGVARRSPC